MMFSAPGNPRVAIRRDAADHDVSRAGGDGGPQPLHGGARMSGSDGGGRKAGVLQQILVAVAIAVLAGGTSPW